MSCFFFSCDFIDVLQIDAQVYFLWVTRDQKHFEWMVDLLRDVEEKDSKHVISSHIFITQLFDKFDIRTVMLVCASTHIYISV